MKKAHENKVIKLAEILQAAAWRDFEYWDKQQIERPNDTDIKRFRSNAFMEYHAYSHILECILSEEKADTYLKIWTE